MFCYSFIKIESRTTRWYLFATCKLFMERKALRDFRESKKQDHQSLKKSFRNATEEIHFALLNLADMRYPMEDFCTGCRGKPF